MVIRRIKRIFVAIFLTLLSLSLNAQEKQEIFDFMTSDDYIVGGVTVFQVSDFLIQMPLLGFQV